MMITGFTELLVIMVAGVRFFPMRKEKAFLFIKPDENSFYSAAIFFQTEEVIPGKTSCFSFVRYSTPPPFIIQ